MTVKSKKTALVQWISSTEDNDLIEQLEAFRKHHESFNFQKELDIAITPEELKKRTTAFLRTLEWKK